MFVYFGELQGILVDTKYFKVQNIKGRYAYFKSFILKALLLLFIVLYLQNATRVCVLVWCILVQRLSFRHESVSQPL